MQRMEGHSSRCNCRSQNLPWLALAASSTLRQQAAGQAGMQLLHLLSNSSRATKGEALDAFNVVCISHGTARLVLLEQELGPPVYLDMKSTYIWVLYSSSLALIMISLVLPKERFMRGGQVMIRALGSDHLHGEQVVKCLVTVAFVRTQQCTGRQLGVPVV